VTARRSTRGWSSSISSVRKSSGSPVSMSHTIATLSTMVSVRPGRGAHDPIEDLEYPGDVSTGVGEPEQPPLAARLRAWRERAMLTQEELAERSGLGIRTIRRLETAGIGRARLESVRQLVRALGLTAAEQAELTAAAVPSRPPPVDRRTRPPPAAATRGPACRGATAVADSGTPVRRTGGRTEGTRPTARPVSAVRRSRRRGRRDRRRRRRGQDRALALHWAHARGRRLRGRAAVRQPARVRPGRGSRCRPPRRS
jgi:transcriptional regulator with XRE-family HTH domain